MTQLRIARAHFPVTVLGPGRRAGIWVQGCTLACPGCVSRDTWAADGGSEVDPAALVAWIATLEDVEGITISGGEPFEQPEALGDLLDRLDAWRTGLGREVDLLCYSGYRLAWLRRRRPELLAKLDALIPEPFAVEQPTPLVWRGSANQALVPLSPLGRRRYADHVSRERTRPEMQVGMKDGALLMIGIPGRGDLEQVSERLREQGIALNGESWTA